MKSSQCTCTVQHWTYMSIVYLHKAWNLPVYPSGRPLQCGAEAPHRKGLPSKSSCWETQGSVVCMRRVNVDVLWNMGGMKSLKHFLSVWGNGLIPYIIACLTNHYWVSEMPMFLSKLFPTGKLFNLFFTKDIVCINFTTGILKMNNILNRFKGWRLFFLQQ